MCKDVNLFFFNFLIVAEREEPESKEDIPVQQGFIYMQYCSAVLLCELLLGWYTCEHVYCCCTEWSQAVREWVTQGVIVSAGD